MKNLKRILVGLLVMLPLLAQAQYSGQNISSYAPEGSSKAMALLGSIFGGLGTFGANAGDPYGAVIGMFNGACLSIAGILLVYGMLHGIVGTAHEGEVFGKKINSAFYPIRIIVGTAFVMPIGASGYSVINYIVGSLIALSIGIGDKVWSTWVGSANIGQALTVGLVRPDSKMLGYTLLQNYTCLESMKKITANPEISTLGVNQAVWTETKIETTEEQIVQFGDNSHKTTFTPNICGELHIPKIQAPVEYPVANGIWQSIDIKAQADVRTKAIIKANIEQTAILQNTMHQMATSLVGGATLSPQAVDQAIDNYELAIRDIASQQILNIDAFKEVSARASQDGWVGAKDYFLKLASMSDIIYRSMSKVPTSSEPKMSASAMFQDEYLNFYKPLMDTLAKTKQGQQFGISYERGASNNNQEIGKTSFWDSIGSNFDMNLFLKSKFTANKDSFVLHQGEHPILAMERLGHALLGMGAVLTVARIIPYAGDVIGVVSTPMLMAGFFLGWVVAFRPTVIIISAIIGWVISCVEAIIISSLWATQHLTMGGSDMVGSAGQGYRLLLNIMLKPVLIVFGIITSSVLLPIFGDLVSATFNDTFITMNEESNFMITALSIPLSLVIYGGFIYTIINVIFNIMTTLPDTILRWVTGTDQSLGDVGKQMGGNTAFAGATGAVGAIASGAGNVASKIGHRGEQALSNGSRMDQQDMMNANREVEQGENLAQQNSMASFDKFGSEGSNVGSNEKLGGEFAEAQRTMPSQSQLGIMDRLSKKYDMPINEADKSSRVSASEWIAKTTKEYEPEKWEAFKNKNR